MHLLGKNQNLSRTRFFFSLLFTISILFCSPETKAPPLVQKGVLDLRSISISEQEPFTLDGEWEFYWNELIPPDSFSTQTKTTEPSYATIPSQWQMNGYPAFGYATYRATILLPTSESGLLPKWLSLELASIGTAYTLFVNGSEISSLGTVAKNGNTSEPIWQDKIIFIEGDLYLRKDESPVLEIVLHVSNFDHPQAGVWDSIYLGDSTKIEYGHMKKLVVDLLLLGSFSIMGFYHFGFFLNRKKDKSPLYFSLFCFLMAIRIVTVGERYIVHTFPTVPFKLVHRIEFLTFYLGSSAFFLFFKSVFPKDNNRFIFSVIQSTLIACSIPVILLPMELYTRTLIFVQILNLFAIFYLFIILLLAIKNKRNGAPVFLLGFIVFAITIVHDLIRSMGLIFTPAISSYGFLTFVFFQAHLLSSRFTEAFTEAERYSSALGKLTEDLEKRVQERTLDLERTNQLIRSLNENLDIKSIMQKVISFIRENYSIQYYGLIVPEKDANFFQFFSFELPKFVDDDQIKSIKKIKIPKADILSAHSMAVGAKRPILIRKLKKRLLSEEEILLQTIVKYDSILIIPLIVENQFIGFLDFFNVGKIYLTKEELGRISNLGDQLAGIINGSNLFEEVQKKTAELNKTMHLIQRDHSVAQKIQENMLYIQPEVQQVLNVAKIYQPASQVGGDFYTAELVFKNTYRFFLADATGHGVQGAMITMAIKGIYDNIKSYEIEPGALLRTFNNEFLDRFYSLNSFLSAIIVDINLEENRISYASAGHPSALLIQNEELIRLPKTGKLIGVSPENQYKTNSFSFDQNSRIHLFSDGLFEEFNENEEEFGEDRLHNQFVRYRTLNIEHCHKEIMNALRIFMGSRPLEDDITLISVEVKK